MVRFGPLRKDVSSDEHTRSEYDICEFKRSVIRQERCGSGQSDCDNKRHGQLWKARFR